MTSGTLKRGKNLQFKWRLWTHHGYKRYVLVHSLNGHYTRTTRANFADLERLADDLHLAVTNGETEMVDFGREDRARYRVSLQNLRPTGHAIETATAIYTECVQILPDGVSPVEAARYYAAQHPAGVARVSKPCPDLVAALLEQKRQDKTCGDKWLRSLESMLDRLAQFWTGPLHLVQPHDLNTWLRTLRGGLVYRRHHHDAARQLINFGKSINAIAPEAFGDDFWKLVDNPEPAAVTIKIWTPAQLVKLLENTRPSMIPFTALQAFAGIRHEELNPEEFGAKNKIPLDWSDFDFEQAHIDIREETGKTGARLVPMTENLQDWLKPYAKNDGPVCEVKNTSNALTRAKHRAGLPAGKNESRNILRKSFGSYRLAVVKNIGQVAEEMGNSPAKIKSNYRKPRPEREGKRWFDISPTSAEILQLKFGSL